MKYKGIIFDLDGVLCSTDRFHFEAWKQTAEEVGAPFDETINMKLRGVSRMESLEIILSGSSKTFTDAEKERLATEKNDRYRKLLPKIEAALRRIDDGSYGFCEETGEPIGLKRLGARPIATLSVEAQELREKSQRGYRDDA